MATERRKIIDTDGTQTPNYTTLSAAEAGEQGDITSATGSDEFVVLECRASAGAADPTTVLFSGWTTSSVNRIIVEQSFTGNRHDGVKSTSKYRLDISSTASFQCIEIAVDHITLDGLQIFRSTTSGSIAFGVHLSGGSLDVLIDSCYIDYDGSGSTNIVGIASSSEFNADIRNTIVRDWDTGISISVGSGGGIYNIDNCVVIDCAVTGISGVFNSTENVHNTVVTESGTTDYLNVDSGGSSNNISSDGTHPGSSGFTEAATTTFNSPSTGDYTLKTGSNAIGGGATLGTFTDDIAGTTRTIPWDIGVFVFAVAGAVETVTAGSITLTGSDVVAILGATEIPTSGVIGVTGSDVEALTNIIEQVVSASVFIVGQDVVLNESVLVDGVTIVIQGRNVVVNGEVVSRILRNIGLSIGLTIGL